MCSADWSHQKKILLHIFPNKMFMIRPNSRQRSSSGGLSQVFPSQSNHFCDLIKYGRYSVHLIQHGRFLLIHAVLFFLLCYIRLSGYMGRGLHNGRNGPPQNPFPGKGLYPCDGSSFGVHFVRHPARVLLHLRIVSDGSPTREPSNRKKTSFLA